MQATTSSNGKIERWHKTLKGESIRVKVPLTLDDARTIVGDYTTHYNTARLHSALGYVTPQDKLDGKDQAIFDERDRKLTAARELRQQQRQAQRAQPAASSPPRPAIDFEAVKSLVSITAVLKLLGITPSQTQHRGPCPLHGSTAGTSRCFSANLEKNIFHCFKCGRRGNALDLWAAATQQTPYDAAVDLCARLALPLPLLPHTRNREEEPVSDGSGICTINMAHPEPNSSI